MTRWVRAGNSQKHKKMPEDPSSWKELSGKSKEHLKSKQIKLDKVSNITDGKSKDNFVSKNSSKKVFGKVKRSSNKKIFQKNKKLKNKSASIYQSDLIEDSVEEKIDNSSPVNIENNWIIEKDEKHEASKSILSEKKLKKQKLEKKKKQKMKTGNCIQNLEEQNSSLKFEGDWEIEADNSSTLDQESSKAKPQKSKKIKKKDEAENSNSKNLQEKESDGQNSHKPNKKLVTDRLRLKRKEKFLENLRKKREEKGITLLSPKIERKIYVLKKKLRKKGVPPDQIKNIIRQERRKAELDFRKTKVTKICFNCRKYGHVLAECPLPAKGTKQEIGKCFKCGSPEHTSAKCEEKVTGYPFATCFICKNEGHISRDCPNNEHGIYPKGGKCNLCDNINHLKKDCPLLKKQKEEQSLTLHTIDEVTTIDEDIFDADEVASKKKIKKPKIVTF